MPAELYRKVSGFYSSKQPDITGSSLRVREWIGDQNYQVQYEFGIKRLIDFGVKPANLPKFEVGS